MLQQGFGWDKLGLVHQGQVQPNRRWENTGGPLFGHGMGTAEVVKISIAYDLHNSHRTYCDVTERCCSMQLWTSPWSNKSTNCNIYRIWLILKYLCATPLILSFSHPFIPPFESQLVRLPACKMENMSIAILTWSRTATPNKGCFALHLSLALSPSTLSCDKTLIY